MMKKTLQVMLALAMISGHIFAAVEPNSVQISAVKEEIDREQGECICKPQKACKKICLACKKDGSSCKNKKSVKKDGKSKKGKKSKKTCGKSKCSDKTTTTEKKNQRKQREEREREKQGNS